MNTSAMPAWLKRLSACLFGGFVLALMVGPQEGGLNDFGISFRHAVWSYRIFVFLAIGVLIFAGMTFWPKVVPYLTRPGVAAISTGIVLVIASQTVMNWYDPLSNNGVNSGKFSAVQTAADKSPSLSGLSVAYFDWLAWTLFALLLVGCGAAVVLRAKPLGYLTAAAGLAGAVIAYTAHHDVVKLGGGIDHSLGVYTDMIGYVVLGAAGIATTWAHSDVSDVRGFVRRVMDYRPGLPYAVLGTVLGLVALLNACWFGPLSINASFATSGSDFSGTGISSIASQYLSWLGWALFAVAAVALLAASYLRMRLLAQGAALLSVVATILTFITIHSMTNVGAKVAPNNGANWKNLGVGGYLICIVFSLFVAAGINAAAAAAPAKAPRPAQPHDKLPFTAMMVKARTSSHTRGLIVIVGAIALFYPPMLPVTWQNVLVVQIGVFVLLALGLNVVVGWAGLLDLGYIAFYEIGAYTTAYLVGALPRKPPSWLHMTPLLTIPFAILACLIAGVLLGAPTLRLRGDYLAIVTLGFGEIIQIVAINNPGHFTGGPQGPTIPHPKLHLFGIHITWGEDNLPYWYLLLVMIVIVIVLFYRLEGSRLGRAWAAIREDEVAAQASGVNTIRVKLLAFAIGASTSALAGSFFASQVGYFDPTIFTLQASILIVAYVVFGGMGSIAGAMAGAAALTWLPQFLKDQVPAADRQMWVGAILLAMMIFRPAGLLPARRRKAELEGLDVPDSLETTAVPASEGL